MADSNAVGGLKWVKGEIDASLQLVRESLGQFAENEGGEGLADAVTALDEIHGVLVALQLSGPARLVQEMQQHCEALAGNRVSNVTESAEALELALIQLPGYLEMMESSQDDAPLALLPAINDLRGSRGEELLSEAELLVPASVLDDTEIPSPEVQRALGKVAVSIRPHFHRYLLLWFRRETSRAGLVNLGRLFHQLQRYIRNGIFHELFLAANAVVEAMLEGSIVGNADTKALIGRLDRVIKPFSEDPDSWPDGDAESLLTELMSLIARCESTAYLVSELRRAYGLSLEEDIGDGLALGSAPGPAAGSGLIEAARRELLSVKEVLDLYGRGGGEDPGRITALESLVREIGNSLAVTGKDDLVEKLRDCADVIGAIARDESLQHDGSLEAVADELSSAEITLAGLDQIEIGHEDGLAFEGPQPTPRKAGPGNGGADLGLSEGSPEPDLVGRIEHHQVTEPLPVFTEDEEPEPAPSGKVIPWPVAGPTASTPQSGGRAVTSVGPELGDGEELDLAEAVELAALGDVDQELLSIFRDEAGEHLGVLQTFLERGLQGGAVPDKKVTRGLRILTGSAQVIGIDSAAAVTGALERLFESYRTRGKAAAPGSLDLLARALEGLQLRLERLPGGGDEMAVLLALARETDAYDATTDAAEPRPPAEEETIAPQAGEFVGSLPPEPREESPGASGEGTGDQVSLDETMALSWHEAPVMGAGFADESEPEPEPQSEPEPILQPVADAAAQTPRSADLLNRLIDYSAELGVCGGRLSQLNGMLGSRLEDLDRAIGSFREQLRRLGMEAEAQTVRRFERGTGEASAAADLEEVDPLDLDRFANVRQLSSGLAQTAMDLRGLRTSLGDLRGESETLLRQQDRIAEDLRDRLLQMRLAPFAETVPRLDRVVLETARELGKQARLDILGSEVELDRSVQERIAAPLEHLLRGAVAHGIEPPAGRASAGKDPVGAVTLAVVLEGKDALITVSDDGAGLDLGAVRAHAVERGLVEKNAEVSDKELARLIVETGFTAAPVPAAIAGRCTGLDVVDAQVRGLGGTLGLESLNGRGTGLTIRVPRNPDITEAMLVRVGEEVYVVPNNVTEAAERISRSDLEENYAGRRKGFSHAGHHYRVLSLGSVIESGGITSLGERSWWPVLLARSGAERFAFQVDGLIGSERVLVKQLGPALSSIRWLSGGAILSNGRVAMVLDLPQLIRSGLVRDYRPPAKVES